MPQPNCIKWLAKEGSTPETAFRDGAVMLVETNSGPELWNWIGGLSTLYIVKVPQLQKTGNLVAVPKEWKSCTWVQRALSSGCRMGGLCSRSVGRRALAVIWIARRIGWSGLAAESRKMKRRDAMSMLKKRYAEAKEA